MSDFVQAFKRSSVKREALKRRAEPTAKVDPMQALRTE